MFAQVSLSQLQRQTSSPDSFSFEEWVDFVAKGRKQANCTPGKSYPCKSICLTINKNCRHPLTGQAKTYSDWLTAQGQAATSAVQTAAKASRTPKATSRHSAIKTNDAKLKQGRADLIKRVGQKTVEAAEQNVHKILNSPDTNLFVRVGRASTLELILGDRFRNAVELGNDQHNIPHLKGGYLAARKRVEELNGYNPNSDPTQRPVSAYFGGNDLNGASHASVSQAYGSIAVKLKPQVKDRVTFTGSDSFKSGVPSDLNANGTPPPPNAASIASLTRHGYDLDKLPSHYPSFMKDKSVHKQQLTSAAKAKSIDDLAPALAPTGNTYVEAQVHGQLKPEDIAELHFNPKAADGSDKPNAAIAKWAKDNGVKIYTNGKEEDLDKLINPPQKTKIQEISEAIDKGDFGKVAEFAEEIAKRAKARATNAPNADHILAELYKDAGFDGLPKVGSAKDVTDAWQAGGALMVRGVGAGAKSRTEYFDQFKTGDYHAGFGIYGNGTYVSHTYGKAAKDAQNALKVIQDLNYSTASGVTMRMALDKDAKVVKQSAFKQEVQAIEKGLNSWETSERQRIMKTSGGDEATIRQNLDKDYKKTPTLQNAGGKIDGSATYDIQLQPKKSGKAPISLASSGIYLTEAAVTGNYVVYGADGKPINGMHKYLGVSKKEAYKAAIDHYVQQEAQSRAANASNPAQVKELQELSTKVQTIKNVLLGDKGGSDASGRLATIRGYDAIALDESYQKEVFMNLLNRSKVVVQSNELNYKTALKTVGA